MSMPTGYADCKASMLTCIHDFLTTHTSHNQCGEAITNLAMQTVMLPCRLYMDLSLTCHNQCCEAITNKSAGYISLVITS